ncbi:MAG: universal stress protein [Planctomycetes bacterium]|nr:universal stress protein [Planctomycetota bacterium]
MFERILIGVDGSEESLRAVRVAADLARAVQSKSLRFVVAFDPIPAYWAVPNLDNVIEARRAEAEAILKRALAEVGNVPSEIQRDLLEGSPAESIINIAKTWNSSLIVMGSRGQSGIAELVLGSTSHKVVSHAPCPVLIVR